MKEDVDDRDKQSHVFGPGKRAAILALISGDQHTLNRLVLQIEVDKLDAAIVI